MIERVALVELAAVVVVVVVGVIVAAFETEMSFEGMLAA